MAELLDVCWLEITGKLQLSLLSPATTYAAYLVYSFATTPLASSYRRPATTTEHKIYLQHMGEEETMMHRQELVTRHDRWRRRGIIIISSSNRPSYRSRRRDPSPESPQSWKRRGERPCGSCWAAAARRPHRHRRRLTATWRWAPDGESSASWPVTKPQPGSWL
uniref:Uncharacterized protein n=1 Tax=Oryza meridionalis TaxID=40149 RepID=A0A0E0E6F8_9ORYZ